MLVPQTKRGWTATSSALLVALAPRLAGATEARDELDVRADEVTVDARLLQLDLKGNVRADAPPFHLSADALTLRRTARGIVVSGDGELAFCPCLGTPLTIRFSGALVAPPGDLVIDSPRLLLFGLPIFWLPTFWLRSIDRPGLLPPDIAWRGSDGLFLGGGLHFPWGESGRGLALDLRAGGYFKGGLAVSGDLSTPAAFVRVRYDRLPGSTQGGDDGLAVEARGSLLWPGRIRQELAWSADAIRGARGVYAATEVDAVARPLDRVGVEARVSGSSFLAALGYQGEARRGGALAALDVSGPVASVGMGRSLGEVGTANGILDAGALRVPGGTTFSFVRASTGVVLGGRVGPLGTTASLRAYGDLATDGQTHGGDALATVRGALSAPFGRAFRSHDPADPWRHRLEPVVSVAALAADGDGALSVGARAGPTSERPAAHLQGATAIAGAGLHTAVGRWGSLDAFELEAVAGNLWSVGGGTGALKSNAAMLASPAVRWRVSAQSKPLALVGEGGHLLGDSPGDAWAVRARVGDVSAWSLRAWVASRAGIDPVASRLLLDSGESAGAGLLSEGGWTGGARASIPWTRLISTRGGVDVDFTARRLVAAVATLEVRDACGCFRVRATGAQRIGREGVDVWLTLDVTPAAAESR